MILLVIAITALANLADIFLKLGAREAAEVSLADPLGLIMIPGIWLGAVLGVCSMALWVYVLSRHHLSHAYPVFVGLSFVNISLISSFYLGEELSPRRLLGIGLVTAGIFVVHLLSGSATGMTAESDAAAEATLRQP